MAEEKIKLLFFGTSAFAVEVLRNLLEQTRIECVGVVTQPDRAQGRGQQMHSPPVKQFCLERGLSCFQPEMLQDLQPTLQTLRPDVGFVVAYGKILPKWFFSPQAYFPQGLYNVHASLLPRYRGASPIHYALMSGDTETGLTLQKMVSEVDAGPVWFSVRVPMTLGDTFGSLEMKLIQLLPNIIKQFSKQFPPGPSALIPQPSKEVSYASKLEAEQWRVDLSKGLPSWFHIRAFIPEPGLWLHDQDKPLIKICDLSYGSSEDSGETPLILQSPDRLILRCQKKHYAQVKILQMPGKTKQSVLSWVNGQRWFLKELSDRHLLTIG